MSDEWDFYFARVNDAVSSIFVDLGIRSDVPLEKRPWLLWVWVEMRAPRPDGLSSNEEAPKLHEIGEALVAAIAPACDGQLVGRITGSNRREFYFYASEPGGLDAAVANAMKGFAEYAFEAGSTFQPEWEQYLELLYPSESNLQRMFNRASSNRSPGAETRTRCHAPSNTGSPSRPRKRAPRAAIRSSRSSLRSWTNTSPKSRMMRFRTRS